MWLNLTKLGYESILRVISNINNNLRKQLCMLFFTVYYYILFSNTMQFCCLYNWNKRITIVSQIPVRYDSIFGHHRCVPASFPASDVIIWCCLGRQLCVFWGTALIWTRNLCQAINKAAVFSSYLPKQVRFYSSSMRVNAS